MNFQVIGAHSNIKPFLFIEHHAANTTALPDPIHQNWNEGNFRGRWNALEDRCVPNGKAGEIVISRRFVFASDGDNRTIAQDDVGPRLVLRNARCIIARRNCSSTAARIASVRMRRCNHECSFLARTRHFGLRPSEQTGSCRNSSRNPILRSGPVRNFSGDCEVYENLLIPASIKTKASERGFEKSAPAASGYSGQLSQAFPSQPRTKAA